MDEMFEKWGETKAALLEGLNPAQRKVVDPLLENQKAYVLNETAAAGAISANDVAGFRKILIPMIRRIIPGTIATELVGVQPMTGPVGLVYSLRYKYQEAVTIDANNSPFGGYNIAAGSEAFGTGDANNPNGTPIRAFYSGQATASTGTGSGAQLAGASGLSSGEYPEADITGIAEGGAWSSNENSYNSIVASSMTFGNGTFEVSGPQYGGSGSYLEGSGGRKMALEVISQAVEAGSRKLQAGWTIEAMQDLNSQHGLDIESEMTKAMSAEIVQEIDAEIITDLLSLAGTVSAWDYATVGTAPTYQPAYIGDRFGNLGILINRVANEIARKTRRGAGNYIVVSPMIVSVLQSAAKSVFAPGTQGSFKGPNNTMMVGTLNGTIKVYNYVWNGAQPGYGTPESPILAQGTDLILVGYKGGNGEVDTGYFYCPYIPLMSSGVVVNPVTFQPVVSLMTRYGKAVFTNTVSSLGNSADYYGKLQVSNLVFV